MTDVRSLLQGEGFVLLDGAMGTQLQLRGLKPGMNPEAWNLTKPQLLEEVRSWLERPESLRLQVMDHYHAACCLRALGRTEEACPHLEFAAEFGGGLEVRRRAADLLKELQRPETL